MAFRLCHVIHPVLLIALWAAASRLPREDLVTPENVNSTLTAEPQGCPPSLESWIPGCGLLKPPDLNLTDDWKQEFIDSEISERKFLVVIKEAVDRSDPHAFPGVLFTEKCVIALCTNFQKYAFAQAREIIVTRPSTGESRTHESHETTNTLQRPCGFQGYHIFINPVLLESGMTRTAPLSVMTDLNELKDHRLCRYYSIPRETDGNGSGNQVMDFYALMFIAADPCPEENGQNEICGSIFDPSMRFCSLVPGGSVFCHGELLGIVMTVCHDESSYVGKTTFPVSVLTVSPSQMNYWSSLGLRHGSDDRSYGRELPGLASSEEANVVTMQICLGVCTLAKKYTRLMMDTA